MSRKHEGLTRAFKLVRKKLFQQNYNFFFGYLFYFKPNKMKLYEEEVISFCFVFLILLHI